MDFVNADFEALRDFSNKTTDVYICLTTNEAIKLNQIEPEKEPLKDAKNRSDIIKFQIKPLTSAQQIECDSIFDSVIPPKIMEEVQAQHIGTQQQFTGAYDDQDPTYINKRDKLRPKHWAMICIFGCPALEKSTPGGSNQEKTAHLMDSLAAGLLSCLAQEITNLTAASSDSLGDFFLKEDSKPTSQNSGSSETENLTTEINESPQN